MAALKATLTPHFVTAKSPEVFAAAQLRVILRSRLTANEFNMIVDPFVTTSAMREWAKQLVGDANTDLDKSRRLFIGLARRVSVTYPTGVRSASEAYNSWSDPNASFTCQEYALLYVSLARSIGLNAFVVSVDRDCYGRPVCHVCAGVFISGQALMVDPAYMWFGVPHQKYYFLNDLQTIGIYLCQLKDLARIRIGEKIAPDLAMTHFWLAVALAQSGESQEAHRVLTTGLKLDSTSWIAFCAQGMLEGCDQHWPEAVAFMQKSLSLNSGFPRLHYWLASALRHDDKLQEARDEYRAYLRDRIDDSYTDAAREAVNQIDQDLNR